MKIKVNKEITIYCELESSFYCGNAYHNVEICRHSECLLSQHIHCCDNGYEAIFSVLNKIDKEQSYLYKIKDEMLEVVNNHYLANEQ